MPSSGEAQPTDTAAMVALSKTSIGGDFHATFHVYDKSMRQAVEEWRARRAVRELDEQYEDRVRRLFVEPQGWDTAVSILRRRRIVLIRAEPGSGGRTAAIRLLGTDDGGSGPIHELSVHQDEPGEHAVDRDDVLENDRLLLDLTLIGDDRVGAIYSDLVEFSATVLVRNATLVVVLPERRSHLHPELSHLLTRVGRPDGTAVFHRHLAAYEGDHALPEPVQPELLHVLDRGSMQDIAHLAELVGEARDQPDSGTTFAQWLGRALTAHAERSGEVAALVAGLSGRCRALLLASALLEGSSADEVFEAERSLIRALDYPVVEAHQFEEPDLRTRFDEIGVEVERDSRVRFRKLNYAEAVRRHFWTNFPGLRDGFGLWVVDWGRRRTSADDRAEDVVERFLDACLHVNRSSDVVRAVDAWASGGPPQVALALTALELGLADIREGWVFRRRCYWWSVNHSLPAPLAHVVIAACVDVIAPNHPQQAIVRLHHAAKHRDDDVAKAAQSALLALSEDRRVLRRLLTRLVEPERSDLRQPRDRALFLAAADPARLLMRSSDGVPLLAEVGLHSYAVGPTRSATAAGPSTRSPYGAGWRPVRPGASPTWSTSSLRRAGPSSRRRRGCRRSPSDGWRKPAAGRTRRYAARPFAAWIGPSTTPGR